MKLSFVIYVMLATLMLPTIASADDVFAELTCSDGGIIISDTGISKSVAIALISGDDFLAVFYSSAWPVKEAFFYFPAAGKDEQISAENWSAKLESLSQNIFGEIFLGSSNCRLVENKGEE